MSTYDLLRDLPLEVESYELEGLERAVSTAFTRRTTLIRLRGGGEEGVGEDVTYEGELQAAQQAAGPVHELAGSHTLDSFSDLVGRLDLFPPQVPPEAAVHIYRRWGYESAALDLALRQAGSSLADAVDREPRPVRFVVSLRLPDVPTTEPLDRLRERYPGTRFKLDPTSAWASELVDRLAGLDAVDIVDLKGAYKGTVVDQPADPALYRLVAEAFPDAWIEDPDLSSPAAAEVLEPHRDRITWDAPIHSFADVEALPFAPRTLNVKPSRFGSLRRLLDFYDACEERGIGLYGGGQFELGPGRGQIQYLASLFHADAPNDVAPGGYNDPSPADGLPSSPLDPELEPVGFRRKIR
jgi:hypothetical protein